MTEPGLTEADLNGDGVNDSILIDNDGDGFAETVITERAAGLDLLSDTDGDGVYDTEILDTDGDGVLDTTAVDLDGDGMVDVVTTGQDPSTGYSDPTQVDSVDDPTQVDPIDDPTQVDPGGDVTEADPVGDPTQVDSDAAERADDAMNWFEQSENGFCVPASVAQIVAEYSDQPVSEDAFVNRAIELGYLTYDQANGGTWSGLTIEQGEDLLESFGVQATVETGSIDTLDAYLDQGYNAIAYIDSSVVWSGDSPGALDHAVVVSSIEDGMVYLNDPGTPDGQLEPVPVEVFEQAWSASNDQMIVTDNPDISDTGTPGVGEDVYVDPTTEAAASSRGTIILPIVLSGDAVEDWHRSHG